MDFPIVIAQDPGKSVQAAKHLLARLFDDYPAEISVPVFIGALVLGTWLIERITLAVLRRMSAHTETKVDDALVEGVPTVLRPAVALIALHVLVKHFLRDETTASHLSDEGDMANKALTALAIVVLAVAIVRVFTRAIDAWTSADPGRHPVGPTMKLAVKVGMVPIAFIAVLQAVDYPINSLLTALGVGSLAVGLALQDTLKNMFAGIQIVLDHPIRAGDFVEVDNGWSRTARGTVMEIGLRSTKLRSIDNNAIFIPNSVIAGAVVCNFDAQDKTYVQTFQVAAAYGSDTRRVQAILERVSAQAAKDLSDIADDPPRVTLRQLGDSSVDFTIEVKFKQYAGRGPILTELYHRFYESLRAEGIEIPFPTRTLYLRRVPAAAAPTAATPSP